ncbi:aldo/keto reductase [Enterovibrio coralii]|uniref:Oxidoreductase n=1 Tax=Enterovibrio coralii TaxID=294935 RepID=A0A135I5Q4_9GAMM|nr:aldo/keto reductase [Enterovibrio coralii]KXF80780.1 oxidoreductase [Enterovibrio coralii]
MSLISKVLMSPEGPSFSSLVQGYWRMAEWGMSPQERLTFLKSHMEMGITTVDHAHVYGKPPCETLFGEALKLEPSIRDEIEIITKCGIVPVPPVDGRPEVSHYNSSRQHILESVDLSLSRMGIENIDVLLIHRPDWLMDADEVVEAFDALKQSGKVSHFGVSNFTPSQLALLQSRLSDVLVTNQIEINPFNMGALEDGSLDMLQQARVRPMAWSILGGGRLFNGNDEQTLRVRTALEQVAAEVGASSVDQVAYAWVMKLPSNPVALIGSGKIERVAEAVEATKISLSHEQWYRIWVASKGNGVA